jgi:hypothetical protein
MRRRIPSPLALVVVFGLLWPADLPAQVDASLRGLISQLFILGSGDDPLFLGGSASPNNPDAIREHGHHFVPAAVAENASLIGFITGAISSSIGSVPIGATSGGVTFRFEGGVPVKTSTSAGPIFAERAQTLGRGRALVGIGRSAFRFSTLRGVPMDNIELTFTHENVDFAGCDTVHGGDCSQMGLPGLENEIMPFRLALDLDVRVTTLYVTYGLWDRVDVGIVLPVVSTTMDGQSLAQIVPFGGPNAAHFFDGTPESPVLSASRSVNGSALGLGDVAVRTKIALREAQHHGLAVLGEARFATGSAEDLLGAGAFSARAFVVLSGRIDAFSPHVNVGYAYHARKTERFRSDAVLATVGFDHLLSEHVTLAVDVVSELQVGESRLQLPGPVQIEVPFRRIVQPTVIPDTRDDLVSGSFGFKAVLPSGFTGVANALVPLNSGGMRARVIYTFGLELNF